MTNATFAIATWLLAWVFAWSGVAKVFRPEAASRALVSFGVVKHARPSLGVFLGVVELSLAVMLPAPTTTTVVSLTALMLLAAFTFLIARSLHEGQRFPCGCFGDNGTDISPWTLVRAAALAVLALGVVATSRVATAPTGFDGVSLSALAAVSLLAGGVLLAQVPKLVHPLSPRRALWPRSTS